MTYGDFLAELGKAQLTVKAFADLISMNRNSVSNYAASGEVPKHLALIAALLAEMSIQKLPYSHVVARADIAPKRSRGAAKRGRFGGNKQAQLELGA